MADDPQKPERTTSAAKEHLPDALSRARSLKQEFDHAKSATDKTPEQEKSGTAIPPPRTRKPQLLHEPKGPMGIAGARLVEPARQAREEARAKALNQALNDRAKQQKMLDLDKDKDKEK